MMSISLDNLGKIRLLYELHFLHDVIYKHPTLVFFIFLLSEMVNLILLLRKGKGDNQLLLRVERYERIFHN